MVCISALLLGQYILCFLNLQWKLLAKRVDSLSGGMKFLFIHTGVHSKFDIELCWEINKRWSMAKLETYRLLFGWSAVTKSPSSSKNLSGTKSHGLSQYLSSWCRLKTFIQIWNNHISINSSLLYFVSSRLVIFLQHSKIKRNQEKNIFLICRLRASLGRSAGTKCRPSPKNIWSVVLGAP